MAKQQKAPLPIVTNVVSTVELGCTLKLEDICQSGYKYIEHTDCSAKGKKFTEVVTLGLRGTSVVGRIFRNGKMVCLGETSNEGSRLAARKFARIVQKMGFPVRFLNFKITNVTGKWDLKFKIRLPELMEKALGKENCTYDEERSQVLYYHMKNPKITLGIFLGGKVTLLGGKSDKDVFEACKSVYPILRKFRNKQASSSSARPKPKK